MNQFFIRDNLESWAQNSVFFSDGLCFFRRLVCRSFGLFYKHFHFLVNFASPPRLKCARLFLPPVRPPSYSLRQELIRPFGGQQVRKAFFEGNFNGYSLLCWVHLVSIGLVMFFFLCFCSAFFYMRKQPDFIFN